MSALMAHANKSHSRKHGKDARILTIAETNAETNQQTIANIGTAKRLRLQNFSWIFSEVRPLSRCGWQGPSPADARAHEFPDPSPPDACAPPVLGVVHSLMAHAPSAFGVNPPPAILLERFPGSG